MSAAKEMVFSAALRFLNLYTLYIMCRFFVNLILPDESNFALFFRPVSRFPAVLF